MRQRPKVLIGYFNDDIRNRVAAAIAAAGFETIGVSTGREMMQRLGKASDIDLLFFEENLPQPGLAQLLGQLRADRFAAQLPILLTAAPPQADPFGPASGGPDSAPPSLINEAARHEESLRRYTAPWPNITVIPATLALDGRALHPLLVSRLIDPANPTLSAKEMKDYSERPSRTWLAWRGEISGYDVTPAGPTVLAALRTPSKLTPKGQGFAIEIAARLRSEDADSASP